MKQRSRARHMSSYRIDARYRAAISPGVQQRPSNLGVCAALPEVADCSSASVTPARAQRRCRSRVKAQIDPRVLLADAAGRDHCPARRLVRSPALGARSLLVVEQQGAHIPAEWLLLLFGLFRGGAGGSSDLGIALALLHGCVG